MENVSPQIPAQPQFRIEEEAGAEPEPGQGVALLSPRNSTALAFQERSMSAAP